MSWPQMSMMGYMCLRKPASDCKASATRVLPDSAQLLSANKPRRRNPATRCCRVSTPVLVLSISLKTSVGPPHLSLHHLAIALISSAASGSKDSKARTLDALESNACQSSMTSPRKPSAVSAVQNSRKSRSPSPSTSKYRRQATTMLPSPLRRMTSKNDALGLGRALAPLGLGRPPEPLGLGRALAPLLECRRDREPLPWLSWACASDLSPTAALSTVSVSPRLPLSEALLPGGPSSLRSTSQPWQAGSGLGVTASALLWPLSWTSSSGNSEAASREAV
mmetsp:Transcript_66697/g.126197  ORF Transcript_66697/g.126197 Transcript_66697/m.126197 type:complete len:279 (-) Transcript_66697:346-1182(-)